MHLSRRKAVLLAVAVVALLAGVVAWIVLPLPQRVAVTTTDEVRARSAVASASGGEPVDTDCIRARAFPRVVCGITIRTRLNATRCELWTVALLDHRVTSRAARFSGVHCPR